MEFNSIYGAIKIDREYTKSVEFLKSLGKDDYYPFINTNMFSYGDYEVPYYYNNMILSFAATYKGFGLELVDWNILVLKLEHILRNIDFEIAQFHVDSYTGNYTLAWIHKEKYFNPNHEYSDELYQLKKTEEWYFGYGKRSMTTGTLDGKLEEYDKLDHEDIFNFKYPLTFDEAAIAIIKEAYEKSVHLLTGSIINIEKYKPQNQELSDRIYEILYKLKLKGKIDFVNHLNGEIIINEQPWFIDGGF